MADTCATHHLSRILSITFAIMQPCLLFATYPEDLMSMANRRADALGNARIRQA